MEIVSCLCLERSLFIMLTWMRPFLRRIDRSDKTTNFVRHMQNTDQTYQWGTERPFNDYSSYIKRTFGERVQKLSINAGFTCPNRDGTKGIKGCTYCNNLSFNPAYCKPRKSITQQLDEGVEFFERKGKSQKYLGYFQAYTNTYAELSLLQELYEEALAYPGVLGLVISTRPDCLKQETLDYIASLAKDHYISLEFGMESFNDATLININRCHTAQETRDAIINASGRGIHIGGHMVLGLPGDDKKTILGFADQISELPLQLLKLHHLQIVTGSTMYRQYQENPGFVDLFSVKSYCDLLVKFIEHLRSDIIIERFTAEAPKDILIAPKWGLKNFEFTNIFESRLLEEGSYQGKHCTRSEVVG